MIIIISGYSNVGVDLGCVGSEAPIILLLFCRKKKYKMMTTKLDLTSGLVSFVSPC